MWHSFLQKIVKLIDPKLEKYREKKEVEKPKPYAPKTLEDFVGVIQRTPKSVLSSQDRKKIAAIMSFDERTVDDLMVPR
jgi:CBS domain containing-hemolysin-like protein